MSYKNKVSICLLSIILYIPCSYARSAADEDSLINQMHKRYCIFSGILDVKAGGKASDRWDEEFKMLEEKHDWPNFEAMHDELSTFVTLPNNLVKNCSNLRAYLSALVNYVGSRPDNKNITKNIRGVVDYISQHQLADETSDLTEKQGDQTETFCVDSNCASTSNDSTEALKNNQENPWIPCNGELVDKHVHALSSIGEVLYIGTSGGVLCGGVWGGGAFRSDDGGKTWVAINNGLTCKGVNVLYAVDGILYAGTNVDGVFKSEDSGKNWVAISNGLTDKSVNAFLSVNGVLYAGTTRGIFKSENGGKKWVEISKGLTGYDTWLESFKWVNALHSVGGVLYAGTGSGIFRSDDGGKNWVDHKLRYEVIEALHSINGILYAGTHGSGVFKSRDGGKNWVAVNNGLKDMGINALCSIGGVLYAGAFGGGVFKSEDEGERWMAINDGLVVDSTELFCVRALHSIGEVLYVGTDMGCSKLVVGECNL